MHVHASAFSSQLHDRAKGPTAEFLERLQQVVLRFGNQTTTHASPEKKGNELAFAPLWLASYAADLRDPATSEINIPAAWFKDLCRAEFPRNSAEAFVRGEALASLLANSTRQEAIEILGALDVRPWADYTIDVLIAIACGPPRRGRRAIQVSARVGPYALPAIADHIRHSPVGYRAVRVLGQILRMYDDIDDGPVLDDAEIAVSSDPDEVTRNNVRRARADIGRLLYDLDIDPPPDPYPARSFWVEAMRYAPQSWHWANERLEARARNSSRPVRERMYALDVLQRRAPSDVLNAVAGVFAESGQDEGLKYAAAMIWNPPDKDGGREWPWITRPEPGMVMYATAPLEEDGSLPPSLRRGTVTLLREALLTIDGQRRRLAIETIRTAGIAEAVVPALDTIMHARDAPRWLREHATFLCGYTQARTAMSPLLDLARDPTVDSSIRHAALWGIGDIAGGGDATSSGAKDAIELADRLTREVGGDPLRQAAVYVLAMIGRDRSLHEDLRRGVLTSLRSCESRFEKDSLAQRLAIWGSETTNARIHSTEGREPGEIEPQTLNQFPSPVGSSHS